MPYDSWILPFLAVTALTVLYFCISSYINRSCKDATDKMIADANCPDNYCFPFWTKDEDGIIQYANLASVRLLFGPAGCYNPVGKTFADIFDDDIDTALRILDSKASHAIPRAKMTLINFPTGPMYVVKVISVSNNGVPMFQGFALPVTALTDMPILAD